MSDHEEVIGPARDLDGAVLAVCDFCHVPVSRDVLVPVSGRSSTGDPDVMLQLCADCRGRVERGEISFDEEIAAGLQAADE